ncbi:MAG: bifunctional phosphoribosylaminoimidazolecarboxamide formyltransferase/IMP cyclohydrolase [Bacillota bacterium]
MPRRVLISVSDKTGIKGFVQELINLGFEIVSTGGTAQLLTQSGLAVRQLSDVTGFPEILDGRVKTLLPGVHAGILAVRDQPEHLKQLKDLGIEPIDMVVCNLYPFRATVDKPGATFDEAIENIDIGGVTLIRAAAKNHRYVTVIVDPADYGPVIEELKADDKVGSATRYRLAVTAFRHTAVYDAVISEWLLRRLGHSPADLPNPLLLYYEKVQDLRYGENPHQRAAFYAEPWSGPSTIAGARQLQGKELSYNNLMDAQAALETVAEFEGPAAVAVKHSNPCGVAVAGELVEAYRAAHDADPVSIFGGIVALNGPCDRATAEAMVRTFLEVVIAPSFEPAALEVLAAKKDLRLLEVTARAAPEGAARDPRAPSYDVRRISGGLLVQTPDALEERAVFWKHVAGPAPDQARLAEFDFAWKVVKHVKSNAIVVAQRGVTLGVGAGQMNRIDSAHIALGRAGERARGAVLASDAFFPFPDVIEAAAKAGIGVILQPGGSIRDAESIEACNKAGITMLFTEVRHFRH